MNNILEKLSNRKSVEKRRHLAEKVANFLWGGTLIASSLFSGYFGSSLMETKNPTREIIEKVNEESPQTTRAYLKNNPQVLEDFLGNYEGKKFLQGILFSGESKEKSDRLSFVPVLNMVAYDDPDDFGRDDVLYKVNKEDGHLSKFKEDVEQLVSSGNSAYFVQDDKVFGKRKGGNIEKILEKDNPILSPIYGTDLCVVSYDGGVSLISADANKDEFNKIYPLIKKAASNRDLDFNKKKFFYDNGRFYWNHEGRLFCSSEYHKLSKINGEMNDYILYDVDKDGNKELVISISKDSGDFIDIYKGSEKFHSIPCEKEVNFDYLPGKEYPILDPNFNNKIYNNLGIATFTDQAINKSSGNK